MFGIMKLGFLFVKASRRQIQLNSDKHLVMLGKRGENRST